MSYTLIGRDASFARRWGVVLTHVYSGPRVAARG